MRTKAIIVYLWITLSLSVTGCGDLFTPVTGDKPPQTTTSGTDTTSDRIVSKVVTIGSVDQFVSAVNSAQNGTTISFLPGTYTFNQEVDITKSISLEGAGIDKTTIVSNLSVMNTQAIKFVWDDNDSYRISDLTFTSNNLGNDSNFIKINGTCKKFRIYNCKFTNGGTHSLMIDGDTYGVIDHCQFINDSQESISLRNSPNQDTIWSTNPPLGTDKAIFIEDCYFQFYTLGTHAVTSVNGMQFVFRHNTVDSRISGALVDAHGNFEDSRSNYSAEIYDNTLTNSSSTVWIAYGIYIRGGKAVIFNNTLTGKYSTPITLTNYRSWSNNYRCPANYTVTINGVVYNTNVQTWDQARSNDSVREIYCWNNYLNGSLQGISIIDRGYDKSHIQLNRDYFLSDPGYVTYGYPHPLTQN